MRRTCLLAACALAGLKVHFLDLIALPITIGIGIDYAVNLAARDRQDGHRGLPYLLTTTGGAVLLCSFTTTVGYGTLMLSANGGIRAFGLAALLGIPELGRIGVGAIADLAVFRAPERFELGAALGLSISAEMSLSVVNLGGGWLEVESAPGAGTQMRIVLPLVAQRLATAGAA